MYVLFSWQMHLDVCVLDQIGSECVNNESKPLYLHRINDNYFNGLKLTSATEGNFLVNSSAICSGSETLNHKPNEIGQS